MKKEKKERKNVTFIATKEGTSFDETIKSLKDISAQNEGKLYATTFNGELVYSDMDEDEAYVNLLTADKATAKEYAKDNPFIDKCLVQGAEYEPFKGFDEIKDISPEPLPTDTGWSVDFTPEEKEHAQAEYAKYEEMLQRPVFTFIQYADGCYRYDAWPHSGENDGSEMEDAINRAVLTNEHGGCVRAYVIDEQELKHKQEIYEPLDSVYGEAFRVACMIRNILFDEEGRDSYYNNPLEIGRKGEYSEIGNVQDDLMNGGLANLSYVTERFELTEPASMAFEMYVWERPEVVACYVAVNGFLQYRNKCASKGVVLDAKDLSDPRNVIRKASGARRIVVAEGVEELPMHSLCGQNTMEELTLPSTLKKIDSNAVRDCKNLRTVTVHEGLTEIGSAAFYHCEKLQSMVIAEADAGTKGISFPESLARIGQDVFMKCPSIKQVVLPRNADCGSGMFRDCIGLIRAVCPNGLKAIADGTFSGCVNLTDAILDDDLEAILSNAFRGCTSLTNVNLPDGLKDIENATFYGTGLTSLKIPDTVTTLGMATLGNCRELKSVKLPEGITELPDGLFLNCVALESLTIPDLVTVIGRYAISGCIALQELMLPDNKNLKIGYGFINGCDDLKENVFPEGYDFDGLKGGLIELSADIDLAEEK